MWHSGHPGGLRHAASVYWVHECANLEKGIRGQGSQVPLRSMIPHSARPHFLSSTSSRAISGLGHYAQNLHPHISHFCGSTPPHFHKHRLTASSTRSMPKAGPPSNRPLCLKKSWSVREGGLVRRASIL